MPVRPLLMLTMLALAGCAATANPGGPQARHAERLAAARPAGAPVNCIPINQIRSSHVLSDRVIDFEMTNGATYRSSLPYNCSGLGFQESFTYSTSLSQLCSQDIITVLYQGAGPHRGASCGLGQFQPVTFPAGMRY
jgi:hypothetical protein